MKGHNYMEIRDILIYFAIIYEGDYDAIYDAVKSKKQVDYKDLEIKLSSLKCNCLTILDADYPTYLKNVYKPPFVLFYYGDISLLKHPQILSVVGTRHPTNYGKLICKKILNELLIDQDIVICSGLALGIDSISHEAAIENNKKTIAVLANGIDNYYLKNNIDIYNKIKKNGLLISEYPTDTNVCKENFRVRNRLIATIGKIIFIPEAKIKSGTMITVKYALELGKDILCVPCDIDRRDSITNYLIKQGAKLVDNYLDILDEF